MTISAKIIADSIGQAGVRLTTMELRYHRVIHSELMTHRVFSRNASSSRAIPVKKLIEQAVTDPAVPIHFGKNQPGMQAHEELSGSARDAVIAEWFAARDAAVRHALAMTDHGAAKQLVNRLLEPFTWIRVVLTSTDYANFFGLRRHEDAQPEIKHLADLMWSARNASAPQPLELGEWHLPYITEADRDRLYPNQLIKVSVARCARVSYKTHDGRETSVREDLELYERLLGSAPLHASPAEHQARPDRLINGQWATPELHGNLKGFIQFRKTLPHENITGE